MNQIEVNALGDACPIPVVKTLKALEGLKEAASVLVHVDNETAVQNVLRAAGSKGLKAAAEKINDKHFTITIQADGAPIPTAEETPCCAQDRRGGYIVVLESNGMGKGDEALSQTLMKAFIYALSQQETLPDAILFYNSGVKLSTEGSLSLEDLKSMEAQGVEMLSCGTCLNYYGLSEKLAVGSVTNMYSIVEKLTTAAHIVKP